MWGLHRVDGLLPTGVFLRPCRQAALLVQMELEPHSQRVQQTPLGHRKTNPPHLSGAQTLQLLQVVASVAVSIKAKTHTAQMV